MLLAIGKEVYRKPAEQSRIFVNLNFAQYVPLHTNSGRSLVFDIKGIKKRKVGINQYDYAYIFIIAWLDISFFI
mgnify:CR=1 FL=1